MSDLMLSECLRDVQYTPALKCTHYTSSDKSNAGDNAY